MTDLPNGAALEVVQGGLSPRAELGDPQFELEAFFNEHMQHTLIGSVRISQQAAGSLSLVKTVTALGLDPRSLADRVNRATENDVQQFARRTAYVIQPVEHGTNNILGRHVLIVEPKPNGMTLGETEPPNEHGIVSQGMRVHEGLNRVFMIGINHNLDRNERELGRVQAQLDKKDKRIAELEERLDGMMEKHREVLIKEADLEGVKQQAAIRTRASAALYEQLARVAPMAMQALVMQLQGGEEGAIAQIKNFMTGLSMEEYGNLLTAFKPENLQKLQSLLGVQLIPGSDEAPPETSGSDAP